MKLVRDEVETSSLRASLADWPQCASSCLSEVEVLRATRRDDPGERATVTARDVLGGLVLIELDAKVREAAATLAPTALRSLDAIHLASALTLGGDLVAFVTYDHRLRAAALAAGLPAVAPGQPAP